MRCWGGYNDAVEGLQSDEVARFLINGYCFLLQTQQIASALRQHVKSTPASRCVGEHVGWPGPRQLSSQHAHPVSNRNIGRLADAADGAREAVQWGTRSAGQERPLDT